MIVDFKWENKLRIEAKLIVQSSWGQHASAAQPSKSFPHQIEISNKSLFIYFLNLLSSNKTVSEHLKLARTRHPAARGLTSKKI